MRQLRLHNTQPLRSLASSRSPSPEQGNQPKSAALSLDAQTQLQHNALIWLRDACTCSQCLDVSTRQKVFQTCDIPVNIEATILQETKDAFKVAWKNDVLGYESDHISIYPKDELSPNSNPRDAQSAEFSTATPNEIIVPWAESSSKQLTSLLQYDAYLSSDDVLQAALLHLKKYGLIMLNEVPRSEEAVERIASRIGHLRETFYGRTWDVKSVPKAKNVAYTNRFLGFHMDLLYMSDPPGLQLLHCLENSCKGGTSLFADGFQAALSLKQEAEIDVRQGQQAVEKASSEATQSDYEILTSFQQQFHYRNAGHYYRFHHPLIQRDSTNRIEAVNWSPPFQAPFERDSKVWRYLVRYVQAARRFAELIEEPKNRIEFRMEEGQCVIFNNRRIVHGRRDFDTATGERWLKGAYIDTDVFNSRCREMFKPGTAAGLEDGGIEKNPSTAKEV